MYSIMEDRRRLNNEPTRSEAESRSGGECVRAGYRFPFKISSSFGTQLAVPLLIGRNVSCPDLTQEFEKELQLEEMNKLANTRHLQPPTLNTDFGSMESFINSDDETISSFSIKDFSRSSSELSIRKLGNENAALRTSFRGRRGSQPNAIPQQSSPPRITVSDHSVFHNERGIDIIDTNSANHAKLLWKLSKLAKRWFNQLKEDFSEIRPFEIKDRPLFEYEDSFSIKYTTDALNRFDDIFAALVDGPLRDGYNEYLKITQWVLPIQTMLTLLVLLHSLWTEYIVTLILIAVAVSLIRNYLIEKGWIFEKDRLSFEARRRPNAVRLTNLLQLNMRVTVSLHMLTDCMDKVLALWTWKRPTITASLLLVLTLSSAVSVFVPAAFLCKFAGTALILKIFILDYIFFRFPRVRAKYDLLYIWYNELPTGKDLERQQKFHNSLKLSKSSNDLSSIRSSFDPSVLRKLEEKLSNLFELSHIERLVTGWELGKRCTMINKEKALTGAFKSGRIFLTEQHLLFMRYKTHSPKNVAIAFEHILRVEKSKHSGWLPGDAQTLQIFTDNGGVYTLGALGDRDEVYREISEHAAQHSYKRKLRQRAGT
ncbi:GRAM domain-containing protein 4 [Galendromus occidentalis]|uniref:GRAM domain-containing protein 4 n=1 Tax=Galendromus occidentalis TaxID=34638 RepID=A0AAJ7SHH9_9ACAR|nr:GRAM domain-containing protein 4 [Galendromus occidentalis]